MLTLDREAFGEACRRLAFAVEESGFRPDIIVGIATGGDYVAAEVNRWLLAESVGSVLSQRPSTGAKQRLAGLIRRLPRRVADMLRHVERFLLTMRDRLSHPAVPAVSVPEALRQALAAAPGARVLVVDDAVDSGVTLQGVCQALQKVAPGAEIRTAVITMTRKRPLLEPDYRLTAQLVRFPWSLDSK